MCRRVGNYSVGNLIKIKEQRTALSVSCQEVSNMAKYEDTIKDIEKTLGIIPGFMKALPKDVLIQE